MMVNQIKLRRQIGMEDNFAVDEQAPSMVTSLPVDHQGSYVHVCGISARNSDTRPLLFIHNANQQSDSFHHLLSLCSEKGFSSYSYDLRGHGRSGNLLGHVQRFEDHVSDLLQVASWVKHLENRRAPLIIGYGLGALIANEFSQKYGKLCVGTVLIAPLCELKVPPNRITKTLLKVLMEIWPTFRMRSSLFPEPQGSSHYQLFTAKYLYEIFLAIERFETSYVKHGGNILLVCPDGDQICSYHKLHNFVVSRKSEDVDYVKVSGDHFVLEPKSPNIIQVRDIICHWAGKLDSGWLASEGTELLNKKLDINLNLAADSA